MTKVGDTLWTMSSRDRRSGWRSDVITGETKQSWIVGEDWRITKVNKKTMLENVGKWGHERWFTVEGKDEYLWMQHHRRLISAMVDACKDVAKLRAVAQIVACLSG